jgi:hypothetical protein
MRLHRLALPAAILAMLGADRVAAAPVCKPELAVTDIMFTQMHQWRRTWGARIAVDASRCATDHGPFAIDFVRLKETGTDLHFTEQFTWAPGMVEVATELAADEAVGGYAITAATCPCR